MKGFQILANWQPRYGYNATNVTKTRNTLDNGSPERTDIRLLLPAPAISRIGTIRVKGVPLLLRCSLKIQVQPALNQQDHASSNFDIIPTFFGYRHRHAYLPGFPRPVIP
jgi:hypothetical protein